MISASVTSFDKALSAYGKYRMSSENGINAAGDFMLKQLRRAYTNYYTTQRYRNTIFIRDSLKAAKAEPARKGWYTMVGVPSEMVVPRGQKRAVNRGLVALGWEIGHFNIMIGDKVRVPIMVPTAAKYANRAINTFARVVKAAMDAK